MSNYALVRTDNLAGIVDGSKLVSFKYLPGGTATAVENGNLVSISGYVSGERDVCSAITPTAGEAIGNLVLVANPEVIYDETKNNLTDYINEAGKIVRGYLLTKGDIFAVTAKAFDSGEVPDITTNKYIVCEADTTMKGASSSSNAIGMCVAVESEGGYTYYVIRVI